MLGLDVEIDLNLKIYNYKRKSTFPKLSYYDLCVGGDVPLGHVTVLSPGPF